ncbi:hypothetical protein J6590_017618 [Homalodisca vitripennis]|nr:hypothetical protein J6590_017618 [Homalodisca vitripennis]
MSTSDGQLRPLPVSSSGNTDQLMAGAGTPGVAEKIICAEREEVEGVTASLPAALC